MNILGFDTSGPHVAVALLSSDGVASVVEELKRGQGERLLPLCEEVLSAKGLTWQDLDATGVGVGPGNFTGIRISVSAARGLAMGLGIPAVGVSMFDTTQRMSGQSRTAVPAPRDQLYLFDPEAMSAPVMEPDTDKADLPRSSDFSTAQHVEEIAVIASERCAMTMEPPRPLYVKPADAAPPRDKPPVLID